MNVFETSDWLSVISILVDILSILFGGWIAYWVASTIQSALNKEEKLKDYFASELIGLKDEFQRIIDEVKYGHPLPKELKAKINSLSNKSTSIMQSLNSKYRINDDIASILLTFSTQVMESNEFETNYRTNHAVTFSANVKNQVEMLEREKVRLYNDLLLHLYEK